MGYGMVEYGRLWRNMGRVWYDRVWSGNYGRYGRV